MDKKPEFSLADIRKHQDDIGYAQGGASESRGSPDDIERQREWKTHAGRAAEQRWGRAGSIALAQAAVVVPGTRGGELSWRMSSVRKISASTKYWRMHIGRVVLETEDAFAEGIKEVESAEARLRATIEKFRATASNDLASIKSFSEKLAKEMARVQTLMGNIIALMGSPEMQTAVANAEALSNALIALQQIKSARLTLAVIDTPVTKPDADL